MLACIESSRSTEALDAYNFFTSGNQQTASEWQWAGGSITAAKSICRDLALRAMGGVSSGGCSRDAMLLFCEIVDEDSPLSRNALLGVMHSFEYDGDWQSSIQLLNALVDSISHKSESKWRLVRDTLELSNDYNDSNESLTKSEGKELLVEVLASSMRVCNQEGHFGLAIVLCSILNSFHTNEYGVLQNNEMAASGDATVDLAQSLIVYHDIFEAYAQSLYGLGCDRIVQQLLQDTTKDINDFSFHMLRMRRKGSQVDESWRNAFVAINRVLEAKAAIELEGGLSSRDDSLLFQRGLSRAMEHCLDLNQPAAALYLFRHTSNVLIPAKDTSLADKVRTFLGVERRSGHKPSDEIFETFEKIEMEDMQLSDSILAALIKVYTMMGRPEKARAVFIDSVPHKHDVDEKQIMTQSMNNTLEVFLEINVAECMPFLEKMHVDCLNPFTFLSIARKFSMHGAWPQVGELYNKAHSAGCISEEFGLIAMKAVSESELSHGKIKVLRNIVSDVSNLVGMNKKEWVTSNYWNIKRYAGFHYARVSLFAYIARNLLN